MESYTKFRIAPGRTGAFLAAVDALIAAARGKGLSRLDCFADPDKGEAICMLAAPDEATIHAFEKEELPELMALGEHAASETHVLGGEPPTGRPASVRGFAFEDGLDPAAPTPGRPIAEGAGRIEIATWFDIAPGEIDAFRTLAREMTKIVRRNDPGTSRYDWFYAPDGSAAIAMDTYDGNTAMRAHMQNCHDLHEALLGHAKMTTEFLGELAPDAMAAISRYALYVLPLYSGLVL
jgi:quinol monooxygenase YgiN